MTPGGRALFPLPKPTTVFKNPPTDPKAAKLGRKLGWRKFQNLTHAPPPRGGFPRGDGQWAVWHRAYPLPTGRHSPQGFGSTDKLNTCVTHPPEGIQECFRGRVGGLEPTGGSRAPPEKATLCLGLAQKQKRGTWRGHCFCHVSSLWNLVVPRKSSARTTLGWKIIRPCEIKCPFSSM